MYLFIYLFINYYYIFVIQACSIYLNSHTLMKSKLVSVHTGPELKWTNNCIFY